MTDPARPRFSTVVVTDDSTQPTPPPTPQPVVEQNTASGWTPPVSESPMQQTNPFDQSNLWQVPQSYETSQTSEVPAQPEKSMQSPDIVAAPPSSIAIPLPDAVLPETSSGVIPQSGMPSQTATTVLDTQSAPEVTPTQVPPQTQMPALGQTPPQMPVMHGGNPRHNIRRLAFLVPVAFLVITIVGVGFFFSQKKSAGTPMQTPEPPQAQELPTAEPSATPKPVPQAYSSKSLSFYYPSELSLIECGGDIYLLTSEGDDVTGFCASVEKAAVAISIETSTKDFGKLDGDLDSAAKTEVDGIEAITENYLINGSKVQTVSFEFDDKFFRLSMLDYMYAQEFETLVSGIKLFESNPTEGWSSYTNTLNKYSFKYPDTWQIIGLDPEEDEAGLEQVDLAPLDTTQKQQLSILVQSNLDNSALTASEVISSTRNLAAWKSTPSVSARSLSGASGEIIEGSQGEKWVTYFVVWYKQSVVQMEWTDTPNRPGQGTYNNLLSTFKFTN